MNEIDKKIKGRIERARGILGIKIDRHLSNSDTISVAALLVQVAEMIEREEKDNL